MNELREMAVCPVCGRIMVRTGISYTLGRKDSMPCRMWGHWYHQADDTKACEVVIPDEWQAG